MGFHLSFSFNRCLIPECETEEDFEFRAPWVLNAIPPAGSSFDQCRRYRNTSSAWTREDACPADWFNSDSIKDCEVHLYENTDTVVHTVRFFTIHHNKNTFAICQHIICVYVFEKSVEKKLLAFITSCIYSLT